LIGSEKEAMSNRKNKYFESNSVDLNKEAAEIDSDAII